MHTAPRFALLLALAATLSTPRADAQVCNFDDGFEDNDTCATAAVLTEGLHLGLGICDFDTDYYRIVVPGGETLDMRWFMASAHQQTGGDVYDSDQCDNLVQSVFDYFPIVNVHNGTGSDQEYWVHIFPEGILGSDGYDLDVLLYPDPCPGFAPDAFEPNDTEETATALAPGVYTDLTVFSGEPDYYLLPVERHRILVIDTPVQESPEPFEAARFEYRDPATGSFVGTPDGTGRLFNSGTSDEILVKVTAPDAFNCSRYDLTFSVEDSPCTPLPDDVFEPNQSCAEATQLPRGFHPGLSLFRGDWDYYLVDIPPGEFLRIDAIYDPALDDLFDLKLHPDGFPGIVGSNCTGFGPVVINEKPGLKTAIVPNFTAGTRVYTVFMRIDPQEDDELAPCIAYDLKVRIYDEVEGTSYCPANANSTGAPGRIEALGSTAIADNEFALLATDLPSSVQGLFYFGPNQIQVPLDNGIRCVGGMTRRLAPVRHSTIFRRIFRAIDFGEPAAGAILPGTTFNFQLWHRDAGSSNMTDAVEVTFQ